MTDNGVDHSEQQVMPKIKILIKVQRPRLESIDVEQKVQQQVVSIEDINPDKKYDVSIKQLLNSPRTMEACKRQGVDPKDMDPISEEQVRKLIAQRDRGKRAIPQVLVDIRMKHYEDKRRDVIRLIREVRS